MHQLRVVQPETPQPPEVSGSRTRPIITMIFALPALLLLSMLRRLLAIGTTSSTIDGQDPDQPDADTARAEVIPFPKPAPK